MDKPGNGGAPEGVPRPYETEEEFAEAAGFVTFPDTHRRKVRFGGERPFEISLRPMELRPKRKIAAAWKEVLTHLYRQGGEQFDHDVYDQMVEPLIESVFQILAYYRVPDLSKDWIEDRLSEGEMLDLVQAQLALERANDFMLSGARRALELLVSVTKLFAGAGLVERLASSALSAERGTAPSTSSSSDTPPGS